MTRYRWVAARKAEGFPITMACRVAEVSRQAFGDWRARQAAGPSSAEVAEAALVAEIREIHDESDGTYGEPRITPELARRGRAVNHKRVERLMRLHEVVGVHKPAKVRTTIPVLLMSPGSATSPTSPPVRAGSIWRRCSTSDPGGCWATRWPITCAPSWSPTHSPWRRAPGAAPRPGSSSMVTAAASTSRATTERSSPTSAWSNR